MKPSHFAEHIDSYYAHTLNQTIQYPQLTQPIDVETCIIGGGLSGIGVALPLAEQGHQVAVIEAARIGFGASGRNGGQVIHGWGADMQDLAPLVGLPVAKQLWQLSLEGIKLIDTRIKRFQIQCDWHQGYATVAIHQRHMDFLRKWQREAREIYGYTGYQEWPQEQLESQLASHRYVGCLYDEDSGHLHPLNYCVGLAAAAHQMGAQIFEQTPMLNIQPHQGGYRVFTPNAYIDAKNVVIAVNAFTGSLRTPVLHSLEARILPVGTYIIATEPLGERATELIRNRMAVCDIRFVLDYYRLSADNRLLFGGKINYSGREPSTDKIRKGMRSDMLKVFPQLRDVKIDFSWGGDVDVSMNRAPDFGRLAQNLFYLQGFSGHGVAATGIGGLAIAEAIMGDEQKIKLFESIPHRAYPGGRYFRLPSQWLGVAYYRIKDLIP